MPSKKESKIIETPLVSRPQDPKSQGNGSQVKMKNEGSYKDEGVKKIVHKNAHTHNACQSPRLRRQVKSLISGMILLSGLCVGLLFVDVAQFFSNRGLGARALGEAQVVTYDGSTWVRYDEPKVPVEVYVSRAVTDDGRRQLDDALSALSVFIPTMEVRVIDVGTAPGRGRASDARIGYVPALRFDGALSEYQYYSDSAEIFSARGDGSYMLRPGELGLDIAERLDAPSSQQGLIVGNIGVPHTITVFENAWCDQCAQLHANLATLQSRFPQEFVIHYKNVPELGDEASRAGAQVSHCAYEQGLYEAFSQILFTNNAWKIVKPTARRDLFEQYAGYLPSINGDELLNCYSQSRYDAQLVSDITEADYLGVGVNRDEKGESQPTIFIGADLYVGGVGMDEISKAIRDKFQLQ